ncbi:hypothetical protein Bca4012_056523 [Brassica carinata]|uniref:Uncharacterized protein n=1 Tax=Brassica carinata TaxID=52824 RepID=A0A8X8B1K0_BRACI|nr:hypothetical protein Bca52824_013652 [Brassica carinata]
MCRYEEDGETVGFGVGGARKGSEEGGHISGSFKIILISTGPDVWASFDGTYHLWMGNGSSEGMETQAESLRRDFGAGMSGGEEIGQEAEEINDGVKAELAMPRAVMIWGARSEWRKDEEEMNRKGGDNEGSNGRDDGDGRRSRRDGCVKTNSAIGDGEIDRKRR